MANEPRRYVAYMMRLWQVAEDDGPAWRASLENPHSGERRAFASLEELFGFLRQETGGRPSTTSGDAKPPP